MKLTFLLKVALQSIFKNKMRTLLTMLGIIIGVGAFIIMVAYGQGKQQQVRDQVQSLGVNLLTVFPAAFTSGGVSYGGGTYSRLTLDDIVKLKKDSSTLAGVSPSIRVTAQTIGGVGNWSTSVFGVSTDFFDIRQWTLSNGNFFTDSDIRSQTRVCVIGNTVASNLFPNMDPVGQRLRIRSEPFKIIGLLAPKGFSGNGQDQDDVILAPYTTVQYRLNQSRYVQSILCSSVSPDQMSASQDEITTILRASHKISEGAPNDFAVRNQADIINTANQITGSVTVLLAVVASISLLVGGIGIMNIMLVSVTERTREIGIRMAIGARGNDILLQFLVEAVVLSLAGGGIGILIGYVVAFIINFGFDQPIVYSLPPVLLASVFSFVVGVFFGFYPARKASTLNPIDALRYE
ncbi:MAG: ABC transporter permease [Brevinematales bacterium]